jgi:hypothetical protein
MPPHYAYRVHCVDQAYVGVCLGFPSLSWSAPNATAYAALTGIKQLVASAGGRHDRQR